MISAQSHRTALARASCIPTARGLAHLVRRPSASATRADGVEAARSSSRSTIKLGDRREHVRQQLSAGSGSVDRLIGDGQAGTALAELQQEVDQVLNGAAEPVELAAGSH